MVTAVDICNMALSHIGDRASITSITGADTSTQATYCTRFYENARDTLLSMHAWSFASKRAALVEVDAVNGSDTDSWDYRYTLPTDLLRAISVLPSGVGDDYATALDPTVFPNASSAAGVYSPQAFAIEKDEDDTLVLYTDQEDAVLRYTAYVTDPTEWPPLFVTALSWHLASMLAGPIIKGDAGAAEGKRCSQMAMSFLAKAAQMDSRQRKINPQQVVPWMSGR